MISRSAVLSRTFSSLQRHRNYRLYFYGQFVSQAGSWLQGAAQSWLVLQLTHSPVALGVLVFWQFGPYAILGLVGGAITDMLDSRRMLMATQIALALAACALAALTLTHQITVWEIDVIAACRGVVLVFNNPSRQALIVQLVGREELPNAIALNSSVANATRVIGPGLGGILIAVLGVGICFAINAASFIAVIVALAMMRPSELYTLGEKRASRSVIKNLAEGVKYSWRTPQVLIVLAVLLVISTIGINFNVLLPLLAQNTLHSGPEVFGLLTASFGAGALIGALLSATISRTGWLIVLGAGCLFSVAQVLLSPLHSVAGCVLMLLVTGIFYTLYTSNSNAMVQLAAPGQLQGRVAGLYSYIFTGTSPIGALAAGWLAHEGGTELAFAVAGISGVVAAVAAAIWVRFGQIPSSVVAEAGYIRRHAAGA
jgi:MFS family permease